jgi:hypothetical protein
MHWMLSFNISYPNLIKFPYFMDTIEKMVWEWKEAQRQSECIKNSNIYTYMHNTCMNQLYISLFVYLVTCFYYMNTL